MGDVDGKKAVALPTSNTISKLLFKKKPKEDGERGAEPP